ncbi:hypothetical protein [Brevundimonas sp. Root1423]|uniref:hypothetical protein n=1 Tax=Brevundimonas sp. Root1423 TaxID=1736462 RepID=UPI0012E3B25E|nr:hypothetical protein [Brevundimonas sp. Root1423]
MTDVRDTDPTAPEAETFDGDLPSTEVAASDLPMVDQEQGEDEDDGEPMRNWSPSPRASRSRTPATCANRTCCSPS